MPKSPRALAALALITALALSGCGTVTAAESAPPESTTAAENAPEPTTSVQDPPEPTCAPADVASDTPPEPDESGNYRDGADYDC